MAGLHKIRGGQTFDWLVASRRSSQGLGFRVMGSECKEIQVKGLGQEEPQASRLGATWNSKVGRRMAHNSKCHYSTLMLRIFELHTYICVCVRDSFPKWGYL